MILKASERGGGKQLALHLLNSHDNEHVELHELRGFVSDDLTGATKEAYAVSKGTRAKNFLFSISLNPPGREDVPAHVFEQTVERIDAEIMTAKNLSHYKNKLQDISRKLFHEHNWKMPEGLARGGQSAPRNFTLDQWQQAQRMGKDTSDLNAEFQDAWAISDNTATFGHALSELGEPETLPTVDQAKAQLAETKARSASLNIGLKGLWQRLSGQRATIEKQNERDAYTALVRDREQRDLLVSQQLADRCRLQNRIKVLRNKHKEALQDIRANQAHYRQKEREAHEPVQASKSPALPKSRRHEAFQTARDGPPSPQDRLAKLRQGRTPGGKHADRGPEIER